jgi:SHS2 domain-containing protein
MQETPILQAAQTAPTETALHEYLNAALMQTDLLQKIVRGLRNGSDLSLSAWQEAFEASQRTLEHITKAMTLAQEVFDGHLVQVAGSLSEDLVCDEFQCLTWK